MFELFAFGASSVESKQALGQFGGAREAARGIAAGRIGDVFPDQRIFDPGFPSRRDWLAKIADRKLVQHYTESINIRRRGRRLPGEHFRGKVHERPRQVRIAGLGDTQVRDAQGLEPGRLDERRAAKVSDSD